MVRERSLPWSIPWGQFGEVPRRRSSLALTLTRIFGLELRLTVVVGVSTGVGQPALERQEPIIGTGSPALDRREQRYAGRMESWGGGI
jgi:hypothetical protein